MNTKRQLPNVIGIIAGFIFLIASVLFLTKLDITVPAVKVKFISPIASIEQQLEYSYCYEGENMIGDSKFGSFGCSHIITATTGDITIIPSRRIVSYWPSSHFTYLLINASQKERTPGNCTWTASIWSKDGLAAIAEDAQVDIVKNGASRNEYRFEDYQNNVIEIRCI